MRIPPTDAGKMRDQLRARKSGDAPTQEPTWKAWLKLPLEAWRAWRAGTTMRPKD